MTKSKLSSRAAGFALVAFGLSCCSVAMAQEPESYVLLCKGGNNNFEMHSQMTTLGTLPGVDSSVTTRQTATFVTLNFTRSNRPAGSGLNPGECAWTDRGVNANEPDMLSLAFRGTWVVVTGTFSSNASRRAASYEARGDRTEAPKLTALLTALQNGSDFQVHAYNNGRGQLVMTRFGP